MADELNEVRPGDRITAELMNTLIRRVKNPGGGAGTISVPNVFGINLGGARNTITGAGLTVGAVIDTAGANVDPNVTSNHTRLIINQVPEPGAFLSSGQTVSLTVTAQAAGTTGAQVPDVFGLAFSDAKQQLQTAGQFSVSDAYDPYGAALTLTDSAIQSRRVLAQVPPAGTRQTAGTPVKLVLSAEAPVGPAPGTAIQISAINPSIAPIRSEVQIFGTNFAANMADNIVMFNGVRAARPSAQSTTTNLFVVIPDLSVGSAVAGLADLTPLEEGVSEIYVSVITPTGHSPEKAMKVLPPLNRHLPLIQDVMDTQVYSGGGFKRGVQVILQNTNEWYPPNQPQPSDIRLYFNGLPGGGASSVPTGSFGQFGFALPENVPGLNTQVGSSVLIRLWLDGFLSPAVLHTFTA